MVTCNVIGKKYKTKLLISINMDGRDITFFYFSRTWHPAIYLSPEQISQLQFPTPCESSFPLYTRYVNNIHLISLFPIIDLTIIHYTAYRPIQNAIKIGIKFQI